MAIGRTHLWDPHWTLHAAAELGYRGDAAAWIPPYRAGSRRPPAARTDAVRPRLELLRGAAEPDVVHSRWIEGEVVVLDGAATIASGIEKSAELRG